MHRTQDTYPLSHLRQHMSDHLARVKDGAVETITQNGEAALVVMSPETYDYMVHELQRGHIWDQAIHRINNGERGKDARQAIRELALAKITARGQTTIPKSIREAANLGEGDVIAFEIEGDHLVVHKVTPGQDDYLQGLSEVLSEWISPEDEEAWRDL